MQDGVTKDDLKEIDQKELDSASALLFLKGAVQEAGSRMLYNSMQNGPRLQVGDTVGGMVTTNPESNQTTLKIVTIETSDPHVEEHTSCRKVKDSFIEEHRVRHLHVDPILRSLAGQVSCSNEE